MAQFVEALRYKPEGRGSDFKLYYWDLCSFNFDCVPGVYATSKNIVPGISPGETGSRCVELTTLPPSLAECLEILQVSTFSSPNYLSGPVHGQFYFLDRMGKAPSQGHTTIQTQHTITRVRIVIGRDYCDRFYCRSP
jgi:hypothetical protein